MVCPLSPNIKVGKKLCIIAKDRRKQSFMYIREGVKNKIK
jgi:hypothetical protein